MKFLFILLLTTPFLIRIQTSEDIYITKEYFKTKYYIKFLPIAEQDTIYIYGNNYKIDTIK